MVSGAHETCIGVDVGGTFTDVVLTNGESVWRAKAPSTPGELGRGVIDGCRLVAKRAGFELEQLLPTVRRFGLGTTAVTNTIASRNGRKLGLITTAGFEDLVPIARAMRTSKEGWLVSPESLVGRPCIVGVPERVDKTGQIIKPVDLDAVRRASLMLVENKKVEALVVSFLWSCINVEHESAAIAVIKDELGAAFPVFSAGALLPVLREFERTQFALLNAYTSGSLNGIDLLVSDLHAMGLKNAPLLVHSGGGSITVDEGRRTPVSLAESGPAAGVVAALALAEAKGIANAVTGDVGGTSYDMSIITANQPARRTRGELMGVWTALAMVDIDSVGAGGGSIAWVDPLGILRVGPESAGANPGPACYGRGGTRATVTDALIVLGFIDPANFLGGDMPLDEPAAQAACRRLGQEVGLEARRAAWGIWDVAKASMIRAVRRRFTERGVDPRDYTMISMGGCGALFAAAIADELQIKRVLIPQLASVFSAFGAASADIRRERSRTIGALAPASPEKLQILADQVLAEVRADLDADGAPIQGRTIELFAGLRFNRQRFELSIPWIAGHDEKAQRVVMTEFEEEYVRRYGQGALTVGAPIELVDFRAVGTGRTVRATLTRAESEGIREAAAVSTREVFLDGEHTTSVQVFHGRDLKPGHRIAGPAVIDADDTTISIPTGATAEMDEFNTLDISLASPAQ